VMEEQVVEEAFVKMKKKKKANFKQKIIDDNF